MNNQKKNKNHYFNCILNRKPSTYSLGNVMYIVESKYEEKNKSTIRDRFEKIIKSDFTHLTEETDDGIITAEESEPTACTNTCEKGA